MMFNSNVGLKANTPTVLGLGEFYLCTDTGEKFIGTNGGNVMVSNQYKEIKINVVQSGTDNPNLDIIDSAGYDEAEFSAVRSGAGVYTITLDRAIDLNVPLANFELSVSNNTGENVKLCFANGASNSVVLYTFSTSLVASDEVDALLTIKIKE